jgi:peptidoglycan/LPS O-acetylase OafA/YrhL
VAVGSLRSVRLPGDISYGLYIYAFRCSRSWPPTASSHSRAAVAATAPFAIASWFLVEKPALRLKPRAQPIVDCQQP